MKTTLCIILCINYLGVCMKPKQQNGTTKVFNITCDPLNKQDECHSETLESIAGKIEDNSDVLINLKLSTLKLIDTVKFGNLNSLTISGIAGLAAISCSTRESNASSGAGIVFSDINETLALKNLNLSFCGSHFKIQLERNQTFSSTLTIIQCTDVEIDKLVIGRSEGVGLVILNHLGGKVNIKSSIFIENKLTQKYSERSVQGGGGVYVRLGRFTEIPYLPMSFNFHNCSFDSNVAHTSYYSFHYTNILGKALEGYGKGGGASVIVERGISNILLSFSECKFVSNQAFFGAGLSVSTYRNESDCDMSNVTVEIKDSVIKENGCGHNQTYYGGGAYLSFSTSFLRSVIRKSHYLVRNVSFTRNCAELGGGVHYFSDLDRTDNGDNVHNVNSSVLFQNCSFEGNKAFIGSAVLFAPNIVRKLSTGYTVVVSIIRDCRFIENYITAHSRQTPHGNQLVSGRGTVYTTQYSFQLQGYNHFESNLGTALYVIDGTISFISSSATFINNTGPYGGAVALIGSSRMIVGPNQYKFFNNTALYEGGALFTMLDDILDVVSSRSCFIQYEDDKSPFISDKWNSNIVFTGNKAMNGRGGHAIYATSLHSCQMIKNGTNNKYEIIDASEVFHVQGMIFDDNQLLQPQILTAGGLLLGSKSLPLQLFPGKEYDHGVTVTDDIGQKIEATFISTIENAQNIKLTSLYAKDKLNLKGEPAQNVSLNLKPLTSRAGYFTLEISLLECPTGFKLSQDKRCICNVKAFVGMVKCDLETFHSYLMRGYWIGKVKSPNGSSVLVTSRCPFCDYDNSISNGSEFEVVLPQSYLELDKAVCGETRTGVVCGKCREGYSVHFHSPGFLCKPSEPVGCGLGWLFYILAELVPVTLLFVTVLVLNISFTSGALNGFILYSQLIVTLDIDASGTIAFPNSLRGSIWTQGYHVIYGLFNLDAFNFEPLSFCLWKSASALDILAMKYITILYALFLIVVVTFVMNKWSGLCCRKYCRITTVKNSVVHGISTFLVICYAQCVYVSLNLLTPVGFDIEAGNGIFSLPRRVLLNGELTHYGGMHLLYALPAVFVLCTLGLLSPVVLLAYPILYKFISIFGCENTKVVEIITRIIRLKPLLDSIQSCFKDNFRFFAGLYFLYRWLFQLVYMSMGYSTYFVSVTVLLVFMLVLHGICQPYVKRQHNIIDSLLLADLTLINILAFYNYYKSQAHNRQDLEDVIIPAVAQLVLTYLPLIVIGIYLLVLMCNWCKHKVWFCPTPTSCIPISHRSKLRRLEELVRGTDQDADSDEEDYNRDFNQSTLAYHQADAVVENITLYTR